MTGETDFKEAPPQTPQEFFGDTPWMRQLCRFDYTCELCGEKEQAESYISCVANSIQEYRQRTEDLVSEPGFLQDLIGRATTAHHIQLDDLDKVMLKFNENGPQEVSPRVMITILPESGYTCDLCGDDTLTTAPLLREHMAGCKENQDEQP